MDRKFTALPPELLPMRPGLELLHLAALVAERDGLDGRPDVEFEQLEAGALNLVSPAEMWPELARGLMARTPSAMIRSLRACGALEIALPEVHSLFGVQQIAGGELVSVDLGEHLLNALDEAARCDAPLEARFALLTMNVGKADSPPEHLPVHYRHIERGRPRIEAISRRFDVPQACRELALLALAECERIHRVSEVRAGPVAALLDRLDAFTNPARFRLLMTVSACDYLAFREGGEESVSKTPAYPKAALLDVALKVCAEVDKEALADGSAADDVQAARATAIAQAFRSQRWSSDDET